MRLLTSAWVRRGYQIEAGDIRPILDSPVEHYDPLERYFASKEDDSSKLPLHLALARLSTGQDRDIERFCTEWGLLGLFRHGLISVTYVRSTRGGVLAKHAPPSLYPEVTEIADFRFDRSPRQDKLATKVIAELGLHKQHANVQGEEASSAEFSHRDAESSINTMQLDYWLADKTRGGEALVVGKDGRTNVIPLIEHYMPYFPRKILDVMDYAYSTEAMTLNNIPEFPTWSSEEFWNELSEPVSGFREAVSEFQQAFRLCTDWGKEGNATPSIIANIEGIFTRHLALAGLRVRHSLKDKCWVPEYFCPSLLSAAYLQLMLSFTGGRELRYCASESCKTPFEAGRAGKRHCSTRCQKAHQQRRLRGKESSPRS